MSQLSETSKTVASAKIVVVDGVETVSGYPLLAPTTAATPTYSFSAAPTTGLSVGSGGDISMSVGGSASWVASPSQNVSLTGGAPTSYQGGEGVVFMSQVGTIPSAAPNGGSGGLLYVDSNSLFFTDSGGTNINISALTGDLSGPGSSTDERAALFNGATGKIIKDSALHISPASVLLDGSNLPGAPRYSFASDTTSGMYRVGADSLGFSTSGTLRMTVNTGDVTFPVSLLAPNGAVAAPAYQFATGTGGMYFDGTNVNFAYGGLDCMSIGPSGNIAFAGGSPGDYASGQGVVYLNEVTTAPTTATAGGMSVYVSGNDLVAMTPSGVPFVWSSCIEGPASSTDHAVVRFSGTTGKLVQDTSNVIVADAGTVSVGDGSAVAPTYTFSGDTDTGMYRVGADSVGISAGGVQSMLVDTKVTSNVNVRGIDGTEGAPGFGFVGDLNTGMYLTGSGGVGMSAGAATFMVASTNANVSLAGGEASSYGGGQGVVFVNQASTDPSTNPTSAGLLYSSAANVELLEYRDTAGTVTAINTVVTGTSSSTDRAIVRWDGAQGNLFQNSDVTVSAAGDVRGPDGSAAAPTYSFNGDTDTGMFLPGAGVLGLSAGGSSVLSVASSLVSSAQPVSIPDGLVGAPSLTFTSDTDTGVFRSGADTLQLVGGGAPGLTLTLAAAATNSNVTLCSANLDYGVTEGERVVMIDDVSVAPSGTATSGGRLYVSGTSLLFHDDGGGIVDLANLASGPASSTSNAILRWDGATGKLVQDSSMLIVGGNSVQAPVTTASTPAFTFNSALTTGVYFPTTTTIGLTTAGVERLSVSSTAVTVPSLDVHADAGVEIGGATGASYSMSVANMVSNVQNGSGTFAWANSSGSIMATSGLNLALDNNLVLTQGTETLTIGHDGTRYLISSGGASPNDLQLSSPTTTLFTIDAGVLCNQDLTVTGRILSRNTATSGSTYQFGLRTVGINRGLALSSGDSCRFGVASTPSVVVSPRSNVSLGSGSSNDAGTNAGTIAIREGGAPTVGGIPASAITLYLEDSSGVHGFAAINSGATKRTMLDGGRERAIITLSLSNVPTATSTNTDGNTWTQVGTVFKVTGMTTGELTSPDDCYVSLTATAEWASNSTGYRRLSIMRKTAGPTYTQLNSVTIMAVNGDVTGQTVSFFGSIAGGTDELTVQVEQTSGGNLDVDLSMSFVRYTTNVAA